MSSPEKNYKKLYNLQDTFLSWWSKQNLPFYLTGGTALGRFYINHRYSEDLDFFVNAQPDFLEMLEKLRKPLVEKFNISFSDALITEDFARFFIASDDQKLKIDFVNDLVHYSGKPIVYKYGHIDNPLNILTNKLGALVGRDEPKDYFDILQLAINYAFNWKVVFLLAKEKMLISELVIAELLTNFPIDAFRFVDWLIHPIQEDEIKANMEIISEDFLLGKDNSLGLGKQYIARVNSVHQL